jgi:uncharacterized protein (TIGR02001 family)
MRVFAALLIILSPLAAFSQQSTPSAEKKMIGDASLMTNYVWHGLTQTKRNPAIQSSLYYYLAPSFRAGLWGSNVSYYTSPYGGDSKANALLKIQADIMLKFSQNFGMDLLYSDNRYFESDDRDGNTFTINFNVFAYSFGIESEGNWLGSVSKARYFYVKRTWDVFGDWKSENKLGYTQFETLGVKNYFDIHSSLGKKWGFVFGEAILTFTNENDQFGDYADYFITFSATANF